MNKIYFDLRFCFYEGGLFTWSALPKKGLSGANNWHWEKADPQCELNTLEYPPGSTPLHQIFEEFSADNQKWVDEFVPALEKMLSNGYNGGSELVLGPDQYSDVTCPRFNPGDGWKFSNCYVASEIQSKKIQKKYFFPSF